MKAKLEIQAVLDHSCVEFLLRKLQGFDQSALEYFRLYDRRGMTASDDVWGRCTYPSRKKRPGYRIRCSVSIRKFPHPVKWAVGTRRIDHGHWEWLWREDEFATKEEAFVWIAGHEAFHWLRHSRQIPGRNYETQANRYGFAWLDEWRAESTGVREPCLAPPNSPADASTARVVMSDGTTASFRDDRLAFTLWLGLPSGIRAAFRGVGDPRPVYPWDCVDVL